MPDYLLDTGVLINCLRGNEKALALFDELAAAAELHISAVTYLEMIAGMHPREQEITYDLLHACLVRPIDEVVAEQAGRLIARHRAQGAILAVPDAAIAATALLNGLSLVTYNAKHFPIAELALYPVGG